MREVCNTAIKKGCGMQNILTDRQIRGFKAEKKIQRKADGDGLYLRIMPSGSKMWEYVYKKKGKRTSKVLGKYPEMSLKKAREKRDKLKYGTADSMELTFRDLKEAYFKHQQSEWSDKTRKFRENLLERYFDNLADKKLVDIEPRHIVEGFQKINSLGLTETVRKAGTLLNNTFKYGVTMGMIKSSPMRDIDVGLFVPRKPVKQTLPTSPLKTCLRRCYVRYRAWKVLNL